MNRTIVLVSVILLTVAATGSLCFAQSDAPLPAGVKVVWDLDKAYREKTPTRERVCLNGLWRWQPAENQKKPDAAPTGNWGYVKVPGNWPGSKSNEGWTESLTYYPHPSWKGKDLSNVVAAWYQREFTVPGDWSGRRIAVSLEYLNSAAAVFVDGKQAGEAYFPDGVVEITSACRPGAKHVLSVFAAAVPLGEETTYFARAGAAFRSKAKVELCGLCGDVFLIGTPAQAFLGDVKVDTSVHKSEITLSAAVQNAKPDGVYSLRAEVTDGGRKVKEFTSATFKASEVEKGRRAFTAGWKPDKLWDLNTPGNMYEVQVSLLDAGGAVLDTFQPVRFGFREFWIDGKDFYLNGTRVYCFIVPLDSAQFGPASATYDGARETLRRLKVAGVNAVYTHNYGCPPGAHLSFAEILRAADDVGMLVSFSLPHSNAYNWKQPDADNTNGYAGHTECYVRRAQNHPAVVMYSMNHNEFGYCDGDNPEHIDGKHDWLGNVGERNDAEAKRGMRCEAIVHRFDTTRPIYHHSSGNLSEMYTLNIYLNFVPIQERSDWFEHFSKEGVKPLVLCEYGTPSDMDWSTFRGWFKGKRYFWSGDITYEFCYPEWGSQFRGDAAYDMSDKEKQNLRFEAKKWRSGSKGWRQWEYPYPIQSNRADFANIVDVLAMYVTDNFRAFRTLGVSAYNTWEYQRMWKLRPGFSRQKRVFKVDWENLQRPGYSPDFVDRPYEAVEYAYESSDWVPTVAAEALIRNSRPLLTYIGGKAAHVTGKDHNYLPGETVEKQIIVINNSRQSATCDCQWSLGLPQPVTGSKQVAVQTGEQERIPLQLALPATLAPGAYELKLTVNDGQGEPQKDAFTIHVLPPPSPANAAAKIAIFDPKGETSELLGRLGVKGQRVEAGADLKPFDILIIGKAALSVDGPGPDVSRVRDGLKVVMFEQTAEVLEKRFGFRVEEYGLRSVFKRVPDHPMLAGIDPAHLENWNGAATILSPQLKYTFDKYKSPEIKWCDLPVYHAWRAGNYGNVASVLIEKPLRGDFLPIVDGGFSLQYSPLMECREGKGVVLFCQLDVTGRTAADPVAQRIARNIVKYVSVWKPAAARKLLYVGEPAGKSHLETAGLTVGSFEGGELSADQVLVVGPGGGAKLAGRKTAIADWLKAGGHLLAIGLDQQDAAALPFELSTKKVEYITTRFEPFGMKSLLAGVGPADVHNRDPREVPLVSGGATVVGNGALAQAAGGNAVIFQLAPWQFDYSKQYNLKRNFRRASFTVARVLADMGVAGPTPILERFSSPVKDAKTEKRWTSGLYLDQPEEWDDPYRYFGW